ncbi:MAG: TVP38/TMEM64 family protein [Candidatus Rokubacteria bacterium]|nr:TVP38/TMEM64 family protein [Candidatus Rokubacteria bacterium]
MDRTRTGGLNSKTSWAIGLGVVGLLVAFAIYQVTSDAHTWRFLLRLYQDKVFLKATVESWGWMGPLLFIVIQALQVIISPIPGEATGLAGGFLFGGGLGFLYSTIGLTLGTLACFGIGRWLGAPFVQRFVAEHHWEKMGFIVEAEGAILCFILYLIPGFPKDIISYLFGLSPMPFWVFVVVSTLGRIPGTWILSAQGGNMAAGQLREFALLMAIIAAIVIPLYYYRDRILRFIRRDPS